MIDDASWSRNLRNMSYTSVVRQAERRPTTCHCSWHRPAERNCINAAIENGAIIGKAESYLRSSGAGTPRTPKGEDSAAFFRLEFMFANGCRCARCAMLLPSQQATYASWFQ